MCVCVFLESMCLKLLLRDVFETLKCWLDSCLSCMLDCIHIYVFPSWKTVFKQSRQLLDTSSILGYLSSFSTSSYRNLDSFSTARWIDQDFFWILDSFSIAGWSIEVGFCSIVSQYLSIHRDFFCMHCFSHVLHISFILSSIASCFITFMHFYGFFVNMWFLFKILHVRGRNTCLCKGEMCFILLGRVLTCFFLYTCLVTMLTYIVHIFFICWCMFLLLISTCVVSFLYLYTCFFICMQSIIFVSHKNALMSFV